MVHTKLKVYTKVNRKSIVNNIPEFWNNPIYIYIIACRKNIILMTKYGLSTFCIHVRLPFYLKQYFLKNALKSTKSELQKGEKQNFISFPTNQLYILISE